MPDAPHEETRRWPRWLALTAAAGVVLGLLPPVQAKAKAVGVLSEVLDLPVPRPFAAEVHRRRTTVQGVPGDLYAPAHPAPAVVLVPGATPAGLDDRRAIAVAESYARAGRVVFMPDLVLYEQDFDEVDLDRIVEAALGLARREGAGGEVALVGISYGGAFALLAAADPRLEGVLSHVGTFGAYFDLVGVVQAATTGVSLVDGETVPWDAHPQADTILRLHGVALAPPEQRDALAAALAQTADPSDLPPEAGALHALLSNEDPTRTFPLAEALADDARRTLARFSPSSTADRITVPVTAMHSTDDPAVPYGEALRLRDNLPDARLSTVSLFRHVDFRPDGAGEAAEILTDIWRVWRFVARLLGPQERAFSFLARARTPPAPAPASPAAGSRALRTAPTAAT